MFKRNGVKLCLISLLLIAGIFLFISCDGSSGSTSTTNLPSPEASFTASPSTGEVPLTVTFDNNSQNADEFRWDFGDGGTMTTNSPEEPVSHEYIGIGTYSVALTAVSAGENSGTDTMTIDVVVKPGPLAVVEVSPDEVELDIGKTASFSINCRDAFQNEITPDRVSWEVESDAGEVTGEGVLTAGTTAGTFRNGLKVTAESGDITESAYVTVRINPGPLSKVTMELIEISAGETRQLSCECTDAYGNTCTDIDQVWSVDEEYAGSITEEGQFTAGEGVGEFPAIIGVEVTQGDVVLKASADVSVGPGSLEQIVMAPGDISLGMEMEQQIVAVAADEYGNRLSGLNFEWSADSRAGKITEDGFFTAGTRPDTYKEGITVEATQGTTTISDSVDVTVEEDRLIFVSNRHDTNVESYDLYIMNVDGSDVKRLTTNMDIRPGTCCSPDGRRIFFSDTENMYSINIDGSMLTTVVAGKHAYEPAFSSDGTKVVYQSWETEFAEIYVMDIDGGNVQQLTDGEPYDDFPSWSPDGSQIAFITDREGKEAIYVMNADGSDQHRVSPVNMLGWYQYPRWSPVGEQLVFMIYDYVAGQQTWCIGVMNANGVGLKTIRSSDSYQSLFPDWSPDGSKIIFTSWDLEEDSELYIMDKDGGNLTRLTDDDAMDAIARWAPRTRGVTVTEDSIVLKDKTGAVETLTTKEITARAGDAVVRIETDRGSGSGFIIDSDGIILTNNHVVRDATEITVYLSDGKEYGGKVLGRDLVHDIALVEIDESGLPVLEFVNLGNLELGEQIIVLGYPLDSESLSVTSGIYSTTKYDSGRNIILVQTDSAINPGNSGGPMLDSAGRVVGMVSSKSVGISVEGIGYAVSSNTINTFIAKLLDGETIDSFE